MVRRGRTHRVHLVVLQHPLFAAARPDEVVHRVVETVDLLRRRPAIVALRPPREPGDRTKSGAGEGINEPGQGRPAD